MNENNPWATVYQNYGKKKKATTYMKREKFATKNKTKKCTFCNLSGTTILFGKEKRTLCKLHLVQLNKKHEKVLLDSNTFKKASKL